MGIIENRITLPQQLGESMFLIVMLLFPYVLQNYILFPEIMWLAPIFWLLFWSSGLLYTYSWSRSDRKNDSTKSFLSNLERSNEIAEEANKIEARKP